MKINDFGVLTFQNFTKIIKKIKKWRQDSDEDLNNDQRAAKVRSKSVPEAHLEAPKALDGHWGEDEESNIWGPGAP